MVDLVMEVGGPLLALAVGVIINLINSILELDPSVLGPVTGTKKDQLVFWSLFLQKKIKASLIRYTQ